MQVDWGKVLTTNLAIVAGIVLVFRGDNTTGSVLISTALGYTWGNGRSIAKGVDSVPMLARRSRVTDG